MAITDNSLLERIEEYLTDKYTSLTETMGEITLEVSADNYYEVCQVLATHKAFRFEQVVDLCGVDYLEYPGHTRERFAVVLHMLSYRYNERLRLRVYAPDDDMPRLVSVSAIWSGANWYEREAFDLYGILFDNHNDLRRILTDYGFIGHPFRKDFPIEGHVEMRYDPEQQKVIYEPVSIKSRVVVPKKVGKVNG